MKQILIPAILALVFVLYQSWSVTAGPHNYNGDQNSIYLLTMRRIEPNFLERDYAYGDPNFLDFYTPAYLSTLQLLIVTLGSYDTAIVALHSIMLPLYLLSMFVLMRYVCGNTWVALILALLSSLVRPAIASEFWGSVGLNSVIPRTAFLAVVPLLFWLTFRWLPKRDGWRVPLLGFLAGLSANLHPPSGLFFVQILVTLVLAFTFVSLKEMVRKMLLTVLAVILGVLPTLLPALQSLARSTPQGAKQPKFETINSVIHERLVSIFPFQPRQVTLPSGPLTNEWQTYLAIGCLILILAWLVVAFRWRKEDVTRHRLLITGLLVIILPLAYLVTIFSALDLLVVALAYWVVRLIRLDWDQLDLYVLGVLACATIYSFLGSAVLGWIWQIFEIQPLTPLFGEQARISRFVYLPLYIFVARWLVLLIWQIRDQATGAIVATGVIASLIVRHWHFLDPWGPGEWGMAVCLLALAVAGVWACLERQDLIWLKLLLFGLGVTATMYLWLYIIGVPQYGFVAAVIGVLGVLLYYFNRLSARQWQLISGSVIIISLVWLFAHGKEALYNDPPLRIQAYKALGLYQYRLPNREDQDVLAMFDWVQANTPAQALFYIDDRSLDFRARTHRAVTHSWKDMGGAYYTPRLLVEYYDRFQRLNSAYEESPQILLACARAYQADYIITRPHHLELPLTTVFSNDNFQVYVLPAVDASEQAICP